MNRRACVLWLIGSLAPSLAATAFAAHPIPSPVVYRVQSGSVVLACGGFAFHCQVWHLRGTVEVFFGHDDHSSAIDPAIVASALEVVTAAGHSTPLPHPGDLPLSALEGRPEGVRLIFESPDGARQTAELTLTPFTNRPLAVDGLVLDGFYDEGCCDRFRIDLGNVVLRPDRGLASLDLHDGRFHVLARWRAADGRMGDGHAVALDDAAGYFWFFQPENPEVFVKILDACAIAGRYWLFAGGLTNLAVEIAFFDERVDFAIPVSNPLGQKFATFVDTVGFPCDGPPPP